MRSWSSYVGPGTLVVLVLAVAFWMGAILRPRLNTPPAPPRPSAADDLDPLVRAMIEGAATTVEENRASAAGWMKLGMVYHANDIGLVAERCYEQALSLDAGQAETWYVRALLSAQRGRPEEAAGHMQRSIDLDPSHAPAYWWMGEWRLEAGAVDEAIEWFERATQVDPADEGGWVGLARAYLSANRPGEAVEVIQGNLLVGRNAAYARQLLAAAYRALGRHQEARLEAARGRNATPDLKDARLAQLWQLRTGYLPEISRATALAEAGRHREAIELLERLRQRWPDDHRVLNNLAMVHLATGRPYRALELLRAALSADPDWPSTHVNLALAYLSQAEGDPTRLETAAESLERALELGPRDSDGYALLGLVEQRLGRPAEAIEAFARATEIDPRNLTLWLDLAQLQRHQKRTAEAIESFARVVEIDPADIRGHVGLANARMDAGELDAAAAALADAEKLPRPHDPSLRQARNRLRRLGGRRAPLAAAPEGN